MGIGEELKGKAKQVAGDVTSNPELRQEGRTQEAKGREQAAENQAAIEAQEHEERARQLEQEQRAAERS